MSQASSNLKLNSQNSQLNNDPTTWPPCERCGSPAPLKTRWGNLCEQCHEQATEEQNRIYMYCEPDEELCRIVAENSGRNGNAVLRHLAASELQRRQELQAAIESLHQAVSRG